MQVHRAVRQLGITLIPAYSPEARGRSERAFRTPQGRLPKELALVGITDMAGYLAEQFLPAYNRHFAVPTSWRMPPLAVSLNRECKWYA